MRLPHDPQYAQKPFVEEPEEILWVMQDLLSKPTTKYLMGSERTFVAQVGVGDQAKSVRCYVNEKQEDGRRRSRPHDEHHAFYYKRVCETQLSPARRPPNGYTLCRYPERSNAVSAGQATCSFRTLGPFHLSKVSTMLNQDVDRFFIASSALIPEMILKHEMLQTALAIQDPLDEIATADEHDDDDSSTSAFYDPRDASLPVAVCDLVKDHAACLWDLMKDRAALARQTDARLYQQQMDMPSYVYTPDDDDDDDDRSQTYEEARERQSVYDDDDNDDPDQFAKRVHRDLLYRNE